MIVSGLSELAKLYSTYKIYPQSRYYSNSPVRVFQRLFSSDYYSTDLQDLLSHQNYETNQRGADLPWWGKYFFSTNHNLRVMIVTQDSLAEDAGSVVQFAHLFSLILNREDYESYIHQLNDNQRFSFGSWNKIRKQFIEWGLDLDYAFITDAAKVYRENDRSKFDINKSSYLLQQEIKLCHPHLLILLGSSPLRLLAKNRSYSTVVEGGELITIMGNNSVVSPFPIGNGPSQRNFNKRLLNATSLIKELTFKA